ncbi:MAG: DUF1643 domain-containing protein [Pseudomonadota bacterium]
MFSEYDYTGYFYVESGYQFRSYLDVKKRPGWLRRKLRRMKPRFGSGHPDLMVVMMNPGASSPLEGGDDGRAPHPASPDLTQKQIVKLMAQCGLDYARIVNLSDLRYPNSIDFLSELRPVDTAGIAHSIFDRARSEEFQQVFTQTVPVVLAWGVDERLRPLARRALDQIRSPRRLGHKKGGNDWAYYHARARGKDPQIWVDEIARQL